jgi:predicted nucleic acid-binding protein
VTGDLLDTSVVIAPVRPGALPRSAAISVLTVAELVAGVRLALTDEQRSSRQARLDAVRAVFAPLPVDEQVAERYGELLAFARTNKRTTQAADLLIAATAAAHDRTLITRDERQAALATAAGLSARVVA